jgi:hypothetical protein
MSGANTLAAADKYSFKFQTLPITLVMRLPSLVLL